MSPPLLAAPMDNVAGIIFFCSFPFCSLILRLNHFVIKNSPLRTILKALNMLCLRIHSNSSRLLRKPTTKFFFTCFSSRIESIKAQNSSTPRVLLEYKLLEYRLRSLIQYFYRHATQYFKGDFDGAAWNLGFDPKFFQVLGIQPFLCQQICCVH